ncbi:MAG: transporter substrate-binding domain-containing protein [Clostridia bacterium]|nr:transporter substrate-binding domain-containing protein [Clostridia bacterium]
MKKVIAIVCALVMLLSVSALAEDKPLAGKKLTIGLSPNFMYFETVSETDPTGYEGLDIDIIKSLSDKLGFEFEISPMSFSSLVGSLQAGAVDMVISGMTATEERAQVVDFSIVYCTTDIGCVVKADADIASYKDLEGKVVACSAGTEYEQHIGKIPGAVLKTFDGQAAVGNAVAEEMDGVVAGLTSINGSKKLANTVMDAEGKPMLKYFQLDMEGIADNYSMAFPKGSELKDLFNEQLQLMIDSGELDTMIHQWLY